METLHNTLVNRFACVNNEDVFVEFGAGYIGIRVNSMFAPIMFRRGMRAVCQYLDQLKKLQNYTIYVHGYGHFVAGTGENLNKFFRYE